MRMCVREGSFLADNYFALTGTRVLGWDEATRVRACIELINGEAGLYNDWIANNTKLVERIRKRGKATNDDSTSSSAIPRLTRADYERELEGNREGLRNAQEQLAKHRRSLIEGTTEDRLEPEVVDFVEEMEALHKKKVEDLTAAIAELFGDDSASLDV